MTSLELIITGALLVLIAEVTYVAVKMPRQLTAKKQLRPVLIDTSVLIDGRIVPIAATGFIGGTLYVPRSVIGELQYLADNADHEKRARARHGLDIVTQLQNLANVKTEIFQDGSKAEEGVDERLLSLAKKHGAALCTIDFNLNKVAVVEGIEVLNINELAQSIRMAYLPGEQMMLELVQKGQDGHQAVGYLPDGTMVVVEHASKFIGAAKHIEFIRSLQTAAGKMMFARLVGGSQASSASLTLPTKVTKVLDAAPVSSKVTLPKSSKAASGRTPQKPRSANRIPLGNDAPTPIAASKPASPTTSHNTRRNRTRSRSSEDALLDLVDKQ